jgi:molybdopterin synthase catalytic subunit
MLVMGKKKEVFIQGAITPEFIARSISAHAGKTTIGAHDIFLGQIRKDVIDGKTVGAIEYTAYDAMAKERLHEIREEAFSRFPITCLHIHHSLGVVPAGGISLFVFVSAPHRTEAFDACRWIVDEMKKSVPLWGRELFEDGTHSWKVNTP